MDMRDFIRKCEELGELHRITAEVDWNLEISHIVKANEEKNGPALLFENVKGHNSPVFAGAFGSSKRVATILGMPADLSMCDLAQRWMKTTLDNVIPPQEVTTGPVMENVDEGDAVNLEKFPVLKIYPRDGGRFIGTTVFVILRDPETGEVNLGTYRMQMFDGKRCGVNTMPGKRGERILRKYKKLGQKAPAVAVIGCDPLLMLAGSLMTSKASELEIAGSIRGEAVKIIKSPVNGLPIPADAEIVLEGEIDPDNLLPEGPFGEYTGYYTHELMEIVKKPCLDVHKVMYRNNPILWTSSLGRPTADVHMLLSFGRMASLWTDLERMKIPGIKSVYIPPESAGRFWAIVSMKTMYPGHSNQVGTAVISTSTGHYGTKGVIVVDDDIKADDIDRVLWALACRYDPMRGTQLISRGRSTTADPALDPNSDRLITSRIIMDATIPFEWPEDKKPVEITMDEEIMKRVQERWQEYGFQK
jgi:4-hydroxy-3-polyprenylbenzoate decarboxylase